MQPMLPPVLEAYGLTEEAVKIEPFGNGIINRTWKVTTSSDQYILQRINDSVFQNPESIAYNIRRISAYLKDTNPDYCFVAPITTAEGSDLVYLEDNGFYRLFPFVAGSHSKDVVHNPSEAYEAARQFGRFTKLLSHFDSSLLQTTIPYFHDLSFRYKQFDQAIKKGNPHRVRHAKDLINTLHGYYPIVAEYLQIQRKPEFKLRVTHHDAKISNVLFNELNEGVCVIDLDTVMPGYFISDVGDMMRTYICPVSEEETDFSKIEVRTDYYKAIVQGYYAEMKEELTETEKQYFFYAAKFIIYMQALRFLTDFLNNDVYYGARYDGHNFIRAGNQTVLLQQLINNQSVLQNFRNEETLIL